ncbi:MAG: glycoside hydrolase, partial [Candidatus Marinimicrobia bacterium]|nr:glycoside hydrolase [Candidatus Neomarinimicrobiota bacterium]
MKRISLLILVSLLLFSCGGTPLRPVEAFIDETRQAVCPDRRVNIFDVDYERKGKTVTLSGEMNSAAGMKDLVAALEAEGYAVVNGIALLPSPELKGKKYGVVNRSVANMRVEPSARAEMATQAVLGTPLRVYKKQRGQYYVQTPDGYLGWMEEDAFVHLTAAEFNSWIISERIIFTDDAGFIYSYPSTASERLGDITASSILRAVD